MIKWLKNKFTPSPEDIKLAEQIKKLYETHDITIHDSTLGKWTVSVKKKESKDER